MNTANPDLSLAANLSAIEDSFGQDTAVFFHLVAVWRREGTAAKSACNATRNQELRTSGLNRLSMWNRL